MGIRDKIKQQQQQQQQQQQNQPQKEGRQVHSESSSTSHGHVVISTINRLNAEQENRKDIYRIAESFNELQDSIDDASDNQFMFRKLTRLRNAHLKDRCASHPIRPDHPRDNNNNNNHKSRNSNNQSFTTTNQDQADQQQSQMYSSIRSKPVRAVQYLQPLEQPTQQKAKQLCAFCEENQSQLPTAGADFKGIRTLINAKKDIQGGTGPNALRSQSKGPSSGCTCFQGSPTRNFTENYSTYHETSFRATTSRLSNSQNRVKVSNAAVVNSLLSLSAKARSVSVNMNAPIYSQTSTSNYNPNVSINSNNNNNNNNNMNLISSSGNRNGFSSNQTSVSPFNRTSRRNQGTSFMSSIGPGPAGWLSEASNNIHVDLQDSILLNAVDSAEIERLKATAERIHSLPVDDLLDLFSAKCRDNDIEYIPHQAMNFIQKFQKTCKHRILRLSELQLGPSSAGLLAAILKENDRFARLYLDKNAISNDGAYFLSEMLVINASLVHLDISGNNIGPEGFEVLFRALVSNQSLISLDVASKDGLNRNRIGVKGAQQLHALLKFNATLEFLNLSCTQITNDQLTLILGGLNEGKHLTMLDLSANELDHVAAEAIVRSCMNTNLRELYLSENRFGDVGFASFQELGKHAKYFNIETLDLSNNRFTAKGLANFLESMNKNTCLHKLLLNDNDFSGKQTNKITDFLFENTGVTQLSFERCQFEVTGIEFIILGLEKNKTLTHLHLSENKVRDKAAKTIADTLKHKCFLQVLDLNQCKITDIGGMALADAISRPGHLHSLDLRENSLHDGVGGLLCTSIEVNRNIRKLRVERNPIAFNIQERIKRNLADNVLLFEQGKIPMYIDMLNGMKGKQQQDSNLNEEIELKAQDVENAHNRIEVLKEKLQALLQQEERKMNAIESVKREVQGEYDVLEARIAAQRREHDETYLSNRRTADEVTMNTNKANADRTKLLSEIAAKKILLEKRREELLIKKLNMQSKLREAETATKNAMVFCTNLTSQVNKAKAAVAAASGKDSSAIEEKSDDEDLDDNNENEDELGNSPSTATNATGDKKTKKKKNKKDKTATESQQQ